MLYLTSLSALVFKHILLCCLGITSAVSFSVDVPEQSLVAIRGHPAVLGCKFTPDPDLSSLVVTWQRNEDSRVVHSYYYQQDKLERQSPEYHSRTSLFNSELTKGNASLKLNPVRLKDVGQYKCQVSSSKGSREALIELKYAAVYTEPRSNILVNSKAIKVQFETEGFPKPEVIWLGEHNQNLSHHLELHDHTEDGLYLIRSSYEVQKPVVNVTFTLKNQLLNQNLQRPVFLSCVSGEREGEDGGKAVIIVLSIVIVILLVLVMFLFKSQIKSCF